MKRFTMGLAIGLLVVAGVAVAGSYLGGGITWYGTEMGEPIILYDGSARQYWKGDANGIGRIAEEYPTVLQYDAKTILSSNEGLTTTWEQVGQSWTSSPFGKQALQLVFASGDSGTVRIRIESSDDNTNWNEVMKADGIPNDRVEYAFHKGDVGGTLATPRTRYTVPLDIPFDGLYRRVSFAVIGTDSLSSIRVMRRQS